MQETQNEIDEKMVDIDSSGPDTEVELNSTEDQTTESTTTEQTEDAGAEAVAAEPVVETQEKEQATEKEAPQETKKDELEEYSASVQKRIAKLTKRMREAERQKEEAIKFAEIQKKKSEELAKKYATTSAESLETKETSVKAGIEAAKAKLAAAREAGDLQAEIEAQQSVAQLAYAQAELDFQKKQAEMEKNAPKPAEKTLDQAIAPSTQAAQTDPKAEAWAEKNPWFGQDNAMTYTAFDLHRKLTEEEGFDPKSDEYYAEIDKRIKLEFPHKFDKPESTESAKPVQTVASATRSTKTSRKTVRLTPSQVAIAKKLGVPLEEYAKQLKLTKEG